MRKLCLLQFPLLQPCWSRWSVLFERTMTSSLYSPRFLLQHGCEAMVPLKCAVPVAALRLDGVPQPGPLKYLTKRTVQYVYIYIDIICIYKEFVCVCIYIYICIYLFIYLFIFYIYIHNRSLAFGRGPPSWERCKSSSASEAHHDSFSGAGLLRHGSSGSALPQPARTASEAWSLWKAANVPSLPKCSLGILRYPLLYHS